MKKTKDELENELQMYKALYYREKKRINNIIKALLDYEYLLPDAYRSIIKEVLKIEGIKYHE